MDAHRVDERPPSARQQALLCWPAGGALPAGAEEGPCLRRQRRAGGVPGSVTREQGPGSPFLRSEVKTRPAGAPPPSGGRGGGQALLPRRPPTPTTCPPSPGAGGGGRAARPRGPPSWRLDRPRATAGRRHDAAPRGGLHFPACRAAAACRRNSVSLRSLRDPPPRLTRHYTSQRAARPRCGLSLPGLHFPASPARRRPRCPAEGGRAACRER